MTALKPLAQRRSAARTSRSVHGPEEGWFPRAPISVRKKGSSHPPHLLVYLAGSIKAGRQMVFRYAQILDALSKLGHRVLTTHVADANLTEHDSTDPTYVYQRDLGWLRQADILVAEVSVPSIGVGYEIGFAVQLGKPVLCLYDAANGVERLSKLVSGNNEENFYLYVYRDEHSLRRAVQQFTESELFADTG